MARRLRRNKRDKLISEGFLRVEANAISEFNYSKMPYIRNMRRHRKRLIADAETDREARRLIRLDYAVHEWRDAYSMMRTFRDDMLARNTYTPVEREKESTAYHREHKGQIKGQKERYKRKLANKQTGRGATYDKLDSEGNPTGEKVKFNYDTGKFEPAS